MLFMHFMLFMLYYTFPFYSIQSPLPPFRGLTQVGNIELQYRHRPIFLLLFSLPLMLRCSIQLLYSTSLYVKVKLESYGVHVIQSTRCLTIRGEAGARDPTHYVVLQAHHNLNFKPDGTCWHPVVLPW